MSPLWSDFALARAALADAVARGLIDDPQHPSKRVQDSNKLDGSVQQVRRIPRRRLSSFAL